MICASPNDIIVHGIPDGYRLREGDIISIDCGAIVDGWHGDAAFTMGVGDDHREAAQNLIKVTEAVVVRRHRPDGGRQPPGRHRRRRADAWPRPAGFSVVREYVGHAIGRAMHE